MQANYLHKDKVLFYGFQQIIAYMYTLGKVQIRISHEFNSV